MPEVPRIVVAGVASLGMAVAVEELPLTPGRARFPEQMEAGVTGVGANVAMALRTLGARVDLCTVVGTDLAGDVIRSELARRDLLGRGVVTGPRSTLALSLSARDGHRSDFALHRPANQQGFPVWLFQELAAAAELLVLTTASFTKDLLESAQAADAPVAVDAQRISDLPDHRRAPWLNVADIVFCSHERLPCPPAEWIERIFTTYPGCRIAAVGCGAEGALLGLADGRLVHATTQAPRPVVGTVGAGDTLFASFVYAWLVSGNPIWALSEAVVHAAYMIGELFPSAGHFTRGQLTRLVQRHPVEIDVQQWGCTGA